MLVGLGKDADVERYHILIVGKHCRPRAAPGANSVRFLRADALRSSSNHVARSNEFDDLYLPVSPRLQ